MKKRRIPKMLLGQFRETAELNDEDIIVGDFNVSAYRERGKPSSIEESWEMTRLTPLPDLVPMWGQM